MLAEARQNRTIECCGLLAGREGEITAIFPAVNMLASPCAFEIAPPELFRIFREMRVAHLEHLGIYHSHPLGPNEPSGKDVARAFYPDEAYFIVSPAPAAPQPIRAFSIRDGESTELTIEPV